MEHATNRDVRETQAPPRIAAGKQNDGDACIEPLKENLSNESVNHDCEVELAEVHTSLECVSIDTDLQQSSSQQTATTEVYASDSETGAPDPETGTPDPETGMLNYEEAGVPGSKADVVDSEAGIPHTEPGIPTVLSEKAEDKDMSNVDRSLVTDSDARIVINEQNVPSIEPVKCRSEEEKVDAVEESRRRRLRARQRRSTSQRLKSQTKQHSSSKKTRSLTKVDSESRNSGSTPRRLGPLNGFLADVRRQNTTSDSEEEVDTNSLSNQASHIVLSHEDIEICRKLDDEYERAIEDREIGYNARYSSVRQSAFVSVFFMLGYLALGTAFFMRQAQWNIRDSLLFSIYTVTTVGYGSHDIPPSPDFQAYTIFYILIGIAALTIMVAQVYQCIALEASRAQHARDKTEMARRGLDILNRSISSRRTRGSVHGEGSADEIMSYHQANIPGCVDHAFRCFDRSKHFFRNNQFGRGISVIFPFLGLVLSGAVVVGPIENWTFVESVYFSVVTLTTVGFGDYYPTKTASIWFCIIWMPFSIGFMSLFLGNVAAFYIRLSDKNINRIERQMRRKLKRVKDKAELERAEVLRRAYRGQDVSLDDSGEDSDSVRIPTRHAAVLARKQKGFDMLPTNEGFDTGDESEEMSSGHLFGHRKTDTGMLRRSRILENSMSSASVARPAGRTMQSMKDVVGAVRRNLSMKKQAPESSSSGRPSLSESRTRRDDSEYMSIRSTSSMMSHSSLRREAIRKPSFALRVLVQERFAEIIATDIAGFQSSIEIKENTLSVTIDALKDTADKWLIPRRARKAFRAVAFEALYFVGEHGLITRGADALYDLSPFEFHGLFSPLLASMGDAETMEGWLASTDILADVDLRRDGSRPGLSFIQNPAEQQQPRYSAAVQATVQERIQDLQSAQFRKSQSFKRLTPGNAFGSKSR